MLWQRLPELQEWEWQPRVPCSSLEPFSWALLSSAYCLTPISHLPHSSSWLPAPQSSPGLFTPGILLSWSELPLPVGHSPAWDCSPCPAPAPVYGPLILLPVRVPALCHCWAPLSLGSLPKQSSVLCPFSKPDNLYCKYRI